MPTVTTSDGIEIYTAAVIIDPRTTSLALPVRTGTASAPGSLDIPINNVGIVALTGSVRMRPAR